MSNEELKVAVSNLREEGYLEDIKLMISSLEVY